VFQSLTLIETLRPLRCTFLSWRIEAESMS